MMSKINKIKVSLLAALLVLVGFVVATPAHASSYTLYSWSGYGWSSGYKYHTNSPSYEAIHITATYSGSSGCNSGSDHALVYVDGIDPYDGQWARLAYKSAQLYGASANLSTTYTFAVYDTDWPFDYYRNFRLEFYVGPQSACHLSFRVWEYR